MEADDLKKHPRGTHFGDDEHGDMSDAGSQTFSQTCDRQLEKIRERRLPYTSRVYRDDREGDEKEG